MRHEESTTKAWDGGSALANIVNRAFYTALLLVAGVGRAESAVREAIELWDADCEPEEVLFQKAVHSAVASPFAISTDIDSLDRAESLLPSELRSILRLPTRIRQCYVLRVLVRFTEPFVANLLHLNADEVNRNTCTGLERLGAMRVTSHA